MKRALDEESESVSKQQKLDDSNILQDLQGELLKDNNQFNNHVSNQLYETQKQYFTVYLQKLMDKIPMGKDLVKIVQEMGDENGFEYTFTAAKSIMNSQMKVSQIKTLHAIFDMIYGLMGRYVHDKVVTPALKNVVPSERLDVAFEAYQQYSKAEEDKSILEMQCLLYCIQEILEKEETVQIPNPLYSRLTQQMKAMSEYILTILVSIASKNNTSFTFHQQESVGEK